jgi:excisionase family DNA binding protein
MPPPPPQRSEASPIPRPELTKLLTPEQVADELGIPRETVYRLLKEAHLPGVKLGGRWIVSQKILSQWLRRQGLL